MNRSSIGDFRVGDRSRTLRSNLLENGPYFSELRTRDNRHAWLDNSRLFGGDLAQGCAEPFLMIHVDGSQHGDQGINDIGGVQAAAKTGFKDDEINAMVSKIVEGQRSCNLEKSWMTLLVNECADSLDAHGRYLHHRSADRQSEYAR